MTTGTDPSRTGTVVLDAWDLGRSFGTRTALSGITLQVRHGEIFGLVGADGAGKTTLMQMFAALLDPTAGRCRVLEFDAGREAARITARIGYMSQGFTLYDRLSVDENLTFAVRLRGVPPTAFQERRDRLLAMAGLTAFGRRRADRLSGGMRKKLALCTNLIHEPPLLLLDEPSLGVDPLSRRELWAMLRRFRQDGATVVLATSYVDEASWCDRLGFLDRGRLLAVGTPAELIARAGGRTFDIATDDPAGLETELQADPAVKAIQRLPGHLRLVVNAGNGWDGLHRAAAARKVASSLEDVFTLLTPAEARQPAKAPPLLKQYPSRDGEPAVRVQGVTCRFGNFVAVDDVSLDLAGGEVFGFIGPNGAGKTTLIRVLCGLTQPDSGQVRVAGVDVRRKPRDVRRRVGYMSQRFTLYPDLTVGENLRFFAGAYELEGRSGRAAIAWATVLVGLEGLDDRMAGELSGAIRQRLALACSILHRPSVLFLDEPTSGVDPSSRHRFWQLIHTLAGAGVTVLVTTHLLDEAAHCDRLGLMFEGRLLAAGPLESLRTGLPDAAQGTIEDVFMAYMARQRRAGTPEPAGVLP